MENDHLLKQWAEDFKSNGHELPEISGRVRKSSIHMYVELLVNAPLSLFVLGLIVHDMFTYKDPWFIAFGFVIILFILWALAVYFRYRRGTWRAAEETPRELLRFLRRQEEARLREAKVVEKPTIVMLGVAFLFSIRQIWVTKGGENGFNTGIIVRIAVVFVLLVGCFFFIRYWTRRKKRNLEKVTLLENSFEE
jgi:MFS family permease